MSSATNGSGSPDSSPYFSRSQAGKPGTTGLASPRRRRVRARAQGPAQARLRPRTEARGPHRFHPEGLPRRPRAQAQPPPQPRARPCGGTKTSKNHQGDRGSLFVFMTTGRSKPPTTAPSARVAPRRRLSKDHQRLPKRMGRQDPSSRPGEGAQFPPSTPDASRSTALLCPTLHDKPQWGASNYQ
jgi:hypothetical protein